MQRLRAALTSLLLCIWIAAAGCAGQKTEQSAAAEDSQLCWAAVTLEGGSGKASVESPCPVMDRSGDLFAVITWSSSHYDFMVVNGEKLLPVRYRPHDIAAGRLCNGSAGGYNSHEHSSSGRLHAVFQVL